MYALLLKSTAKENENHRLQHYTVKHTSQDTPQQKEGNCPLTHKRQCKPVAAANFPVIPKIQYDNTEIPNLTVTVFCVVVFILRIKMRIRILEYSLILSLNIMLSCCQTRINLKSPSTVA